MPRLPNIEHQVSTTIRFYNKNRMMTFPEAIPVVLEFTREIIEKRGKRQEVQIQLAAPARGPL